MPTNQNRLAELIRDVSQRRIAIPHLNGSEPLELLLEIGLDKLMRDYEYIFNESKLCSGNDLRVTKRFEKRIVECISTNTNKNIFPEIKKRMRTHLNTMSGNLYKARIYNIRKFRHLRRKIKVQRHRKDQEKL